MNKMQATYSLHLLFNLRKREIKEKTCLEFRMTKWFNGFNSQNHTTCFFRFLLFKHPVRYTDQFVYQDIILT